MISFSKNVDYKKYKTLHEIFRVASAAIIVLLFTVVRLVCAFNEKLNNHMSQVYGTGLFLAIVCFVISKLISIKMIDTPETKEEIKEIETVVLKKKLFIIAGSLIGFVVLFLVIFRDVLPDWLKLLFYIVSSISVSVYIIYDIRTRMQKPSENETVNQAFNRRLNNGVIVSRGICILCAALFILLLLIEMFYGYLIRFGGYIPFIVLFTGFVISLGILIILFNAKRRERHDREELGQS